MILFLLYVCVLSVAGLAAMVLLIKRVHNRNRALWAIAICGGYLIAVLGLFDSHRNLFGDIEASASPMTEAEDAQ